jgi:hypothetical protein
MTPLERCGFVPKKGVAQKIVLGRPASFLDREIRYLRKKGHEIIWDTKEALETLMKPPAPNRKYNGLPLGERTTMATVIEALMRAATPLLDSGYTITDQHLVAAFGAATVTLVKGDVKLQLAYDRGEWFVSVESLPHPGESYDSFHVLAAIGAPPRRPPRNEVTLRSYCEMLVSLAPQWEPMFSRDRYALARRLFKEQQREYARRVFGVDVDSNAD